MSAKHTPGPLHVGHYSPHVDLPEDYAVIDENGEVVATVWGGDETAEANANLFRAAPELLEAAKEIVRLVYPAGRGGIVEFRPHEFDDLAAAIARAEGGQS